jgi:hypothetical protein
MAISCTSLAAGATGYDCKNPIVGGLEAEVVLINKSDIDYDLSTIASGILTDIVLLEDKIGYLVGTLNKGINSDNAVVKSTYRTLYDQNLEIRLFDNNPTIKAFLEDLDQSLVVAVIKNKYVKNDPTSPEVKGQTKYEVLGWNVGLEVLEGTSNKSDADLQGGHYRKLGCGESKETTLPISFFKTSLTVTDAAYVSLYTPAP